MHRAAVQGQDCGQAAAESFRKYKRDKENAMYTLEPARTEELAICMEILRAGREFQREQGFIQWTDDYPSMDTIREDIEKKRGFLLKADKNPAAYVSVDFEGEPAYADIKGAWKSDMPYAAAHRLAFAGQFRGRGLTKVIFHEIEKLCLEKGVCVIRMDTGFDNKRMQHVMEKNGFIKCGVISYEGDERVAYEKILDRECQAPL